MRAKQAALVAAGLHSLSRCAAYIGPLSPEQTPVQLEFVDQQVPVWVYATIWGLGAIIALAGIVIPAALPVAVGINAAMNTLWGIAFLLAWLFLDQERAWITGSSSLCIGALIICLGAVREGPVIKGSKVSSVRQ